jgi:hypothetical protein
VCGGAIREFPIGAGLYVLSAPHSRSLPRLAEPPILGLARNANRFKHFGAGNIRFGTEQMTFCPVRTFVAACNLFFFRSAHTLGLIQS